MSEGYAAIAGTGEVRAAQARLGSRGVQARLEGRAAQARLGSRGAPVRLGRAGAAPPTAEPRDPLGASERAFVGARDGFYLASVSSSGWPYVQFRGGPVGFVRSPDGHTLAWADFRGNRQYLSTGNVAGDERVALFFMDYPNRQRLKVFGRARTVDAKDDPDLVAGLVVPGYRAVVEQGFVVTVAAFDWNCPRHITPRYSEPELEALLAPVRDAVTDPG